MRTCHKFPLLRSSHHDFNQYVWPPEWGLDADAHGKVLSVNPFVPNGIVVLKIPPIRQPYVSGQEFRFVRASVFKKLSMVSSTFLVCTFTLPVGSAPSRRRY
jgi:hypothetical protein